MPTLVAAVRAADHRRWIPPVAYLRAEHRRLVPILRFRSDPGSEHSCGVEYPMRSASILLGRPGDCSCEEFGDRGPDGSFVDLVRIDGMLDGQSGDQGKQ